MNKWIVKGEVFEIEPFFESANRIKGMAEERKISMDKVVNSALNGFSIWIMVLIDGQTLAIDVVNWEVQRMKEKICDIPWIEVLLSKKALIQHINNTTNFRVVDIK
jgi:hypothetical protein